MKRWRKYRALGPAARRVVRQSVLLLPLVALSLRLRGVARTRALLRRMGRRSAGNPAAPEPREIARLVDASAALVRASCLPRTLVLWHLLRDLGPAAEVRLGVCTRPGGGLAAHAWLELDGRPLNEAAGVLERYAALPAVPQQRSS